MAEIFNYFDRQTEAPFITALEERNRESAERIKALMFTFEDLTKLDPGAVQTLLRTSATTSSGGPQGRPEQLRDLFFTNMSERAAKDPARRHGVHGPGPAARRGRGADDHGALAKDLAAKARSRSPRARMRR